MAPDALSNPQILRRAWNQTVYLRFPCDVIMSRSLVYKGGHFQLHTSHSKQPAHTAMPGVFSIRHHNSQWNAAVNCPSWPLNATVAKTPWYCYHVVTPGNRLNHWMIEFSLNSHPTQNMAMTGWDCNLQLTWGHSMVVLQARSQPFAWGGHNSHKQKVTSCMSTKASKILQH